MKGSSSRFLILVAVLFFHPMSQSYKASSSFPSVRPCIIVHKAKKKNVERESDPISPPSLLSHRLSEEGKKKNFFFSSSCDHTKLPSVDGAPTIRAGSAFSYSIASSFLLTRQRRRIKADDGFSFWNERTQ